MNTKLHELYYAALAADDAWSDELQRVFGKRAGDARYDKRGTSTPRLRELCDAYLAANDARHEATVAAERGE